MRQAWLFSMGGVLCLSLVLGCVSKAKARRDAQAAFIAGQHEATRRAQTAGQGPSVTINGPVNTPVLPWTEDLTLAKAIVQATTHYNDAKMLADISAGLGEAMRGQSVASLPQGELLAVRGW